MYYNLVILFWIFKNKFGTSKNRSGLRFYGYLRGCVEEELENC